MNALIDDTYREVTAHLPTELREPAGRLLFDLGLARAPSAGWADVFRLAPSLDLPLFALPEDSACEPFTLEAFLRAHHCACFYSVLVDRMADAQAAITPERERLADHFLEHWRRRLAQASGDPAHAIGAIDRGVRALRLGVRIERTALDRRSLGLRRYGYAILLKLGWAGIATECLLRRRVPKRQLRLFRGAFHLLASALQVVDDAEDHADDEAVRGSSFPSVVGLPPAAFFTAGVLLTRAAAAIAAQGHFARFARWLSEREAELDQIRRRRIGPMDNLAGMVIASSLENICLSMAGLTHDNIAAITSCASWM